MCVRYLQAWKESCIVVLTLCFKVFVPPRILYRCSVFVFFAIQIRKHRCDTYKKRRPCAVSNISVVAISVGLPVAVNNPVPASQVGFQQFRAI